MCINGIILNNIYTGDVITYLRDYNTLLQSRIHVITITYKNVISIRDYIREYIT